MVSGGNSLFFYTENELRTIQRGFRHPFVRATHMLLKNANIDDIQEEIMAHLKQIEDDCRIFQINAPPTRRFKLSVGTEDFRFNHRDILDTMLLSGMAVMHMVD